MTGYPAGEEDLWTVKWLECWREDSKWTHRCQVANQVEKVVDETYGNWEYMITGKGIKCFIQNKNPVDFELSSNMHMLYALDNHIYSF